LLLGAGIGGFVADAAFDEFEEEIDEFLTWCRE
jgi:hypothetical protein